MDRLHPQAVPREHLGWALTQERIVKRAVRDDLCMLCCAKRVNEAGLCDVCYSGLNATEFQEAEKWLTGARP